MSEKPKLQHSEIMTTLDFADLEDSWLLGSTIFDEWLENWEVQFMEPVGEHMLLVFERALQAMPQCDPTSHSHNPLPLSLTLAA